jgi:ketosteroid isomerase-like protein
MRKQFMILPLILCQYIISCQQADNSISADCYVSSTDSISIINNVIASTNSWAEATSNLDFETAIEFYDASPEFQLFDFGKEYSNRDSLYAHIFHTSQALDTMEIEWINRKITPLKPDVAYLYSSFITKMILKSGGEFQSKVFMSGIMTKTEKGWKLSQGQANGIPL